MTIPLAIRYAGSSFTATVTGYSTISQDWMLSNLPIYQFVFSNQAIGGHGTWSNLIRLVTGDEVFIIDHANDSSSLHYATMEALVRRLWDADAITRLILISSPSWNGQDTGVDANVNHPTNEAQLTEYATFCDHYGIPWVDYWGWCKSVVNGGTYHLNELTDDTVHPSALGYANMAALFETYLPNGGKAKPSSMPMRLYNSAGLENAPTRTNGVDYDSRTGTWNDTGTYTESGEVDATITFSATCESYGIYRADGNPNPDVAVSIDGGAYSTLTVNQIGLAIVAGSGAHTITFKVVSGTVRIDEFWAI